MERFFKFGQWMNISWMSLAAASSPIWFHLKQILRVSRRSSDLIPAASSLAPASPILLCLRENNLKTNINHLPQIIMRFSKGRDRND